MAYSITYRKNNETINIEWIVPTGWSTAAVYTSFKQQFPGATIISLEALQ
jgi:hypothetical protein